MEEGRCWRILSFCRVADLLKSDTGPRRSNAYKISDEIRSSLLWSMAEYLDSEADVSEVKSFLSIFLPREILRENLVRRSATTTFGAKRVRLYCRVRRSWTRMRRKNWGNWRRWRRAMTRRKVRKVMGASLSRFFYACNSLLQTPIH